MGKRQIRTDDQRVEFIPNFRTFVTPIPIPVQGICDEPCTVYRINNTWRGIFIGAMQSLTQPDVWDSDDDDEVFAAIQQVRDLIAMSPCACSGILSAGNDCGQQDEILGLLNQDLFLTGGLDGIAPDRPDTFFNEDTGDDDDEAFRREVALCWATHDYVASIAAKGILAAAGIDPIFAYLGLPFTIIAFPVYGLIFSTVTIALIEAASNAIQGPEDIEAVGCCMYEAMRGEAVTEANFAASLDSCPDLSGLGQTALAALVKAVLADEKNWLAFVKSLGAFMSATDQVSACPCTDLQCSQDFTIDDGNWIIRNGQAFYTTGTGWENAPGGTVNHLINISFEAAADFNMKFVQIQFTNNETVPTDLRVRLRDDVDAVIETVDSVLAVGETTKVVIMNNTLDARHLHIRATRDGLAVNIAVVITGVRMIGSDCFLDEQPV